MANEAGPPVAIYSKVSDLRTCMARQIHYQRFDIPMILHRTLTSFHLNHPPYVETSAAQRGAHAFYTLHFFALAHFLEPGFIIKSKQYHYKYYLKCDLVILFTAQNVNYLDNSVSVFSCYIVCSYYNNLTPIVWAAQ